MVPKDKRAQILKNFRTNSICSVTYHYINFRWKFICQLLNLKPSEITHSLFLISHFNEIASEELEYLKKIYSNTKFQILEALFHVLSVLYQRETVD